MTRTLHRLRSAARWLVRRSRTEQELDQELPTFIEMAAADQVRDGATPAEARRRARLQLGGVEQVKERVRSGRQGAWLDDARRDVGYAIRQLRRNRAFSTIAIATLALGIGVNTAMFSLVHRILIAELPVREPERLVVLGRSNPEQGDQARFDYAFCRALDADARDVFEDVLGVFIGAAAAVLAGLGLYGILAWVVATRTREIAVRLALGATPASVVMTVTIEAWKALALGAILGTIVAAVAARYFGALLYGVSPLDPASFAAGVIVLAALVTVAAAVAVRRASRTDPVAVLRGV